MRVQGQLTTSKKQKQWAKYQEAETHRVKLDCYNKTFECMNEEGNPVVVKGIPKVILVRKISAMQLKKFCRKGFQLYVAHILKETREETPRLEDY